MVEHEIIKGKLLDLRKEHSSIQDDIDKIMEKQNFDQLQVQRLKRRKLLLKDQISHLERILCDDIIA